MRTAADFRRFLATYPANPDEMRQGKVTWPLMQAERFGHTLAAIERCLARLGSDRPRILDIGAYPGSLLKLLRLWLDLKDAELHATGLAVSGAVEADYRAHGIASSQVNCDPIIALGPPVPDRLPYPDASLDLVLCTEIVEHLLDPSHLLGEVRRVLRPGGLLLVTTPNHARITNRLKLLLGQSVNEPLPSSIVFDKHDWRPHLREYTLAEMTYMLERLRFRVVEAEHIDLTSDDERLWSGPVSLKLRLLKLALRLLSAYPPFRFGLLLVGERST